MNKPTCGLYKIKIYRNNALEQFDTKDDVLLSEKCIFLDDDFTLEEIKRLLSEVADGAVEDTKEVRK
jgi:DNA-binding transcriptional MerR regulator